MNLMFVPLIGAAVGAVAAALYGLTGPVAVVVFWTAVPLVLGEPYLGGKNRSWWSRIGIAAALFSEWLLLPMAVSAHDALTVCIATQVVPRAAAVALAWISRPAANPPAYTRSLTSTEALVAMAQGIAAAFWTGWVPAIFILIACYLVTRGMRAWAYRSNGGINHTWLVYARLAMEVCVLLVLSVPLQAVSPKF